MTDYVPWEGPFPKGMKIMENITTGPVLWTERGILVSLSDENEICLMIPLTPSPLGKWVGIKLDSTDHARQIAEWLNLMADELDG